MSTETEQNQPSPGPGILSASGQGSHGLRPEANPNGDVRGPSLDTGRQGRDLGPEQRLTPSAIPVPKDIILSSSEIEALARSGAVHRFDANLEAIKALKTLEAQNRPATPEEQSILSKYSGFGDSAFNQAFETVPHRQHDEAWKRRGDTLREITTKDEYQAIEQSRLNAFYTSPEVVNSMWKALKQLGADNLAAPRVLEPSAGSGRFLGLQPVDIAARSQRMAVELDSLTGRILKHTYPQTETYVMGFQDAPIPNDSVDLAISNVPFGNYPVTDPEYRKGKRFLSRQIHNYFFAKTLDKLRPGGVLAFVTSHYTLDAPTAKPIREALSEQADMIGAIRLPKSAFKDTEVVTDIIFMRKRLPSENPGDKSWVDTQPVELPVEDRGYRYQTKVNVNKYFIDHPEMVLGKHSTSGTMYSRADYSVDAVPGVSIPDALNSAITKLPQNILKDAPRTEQYPKVGRGSRGELWNERYVGGHSLLDWDYCRDRNIIHTWVRMPWGHCLYYNYGTNHNWLPDANYCCCSSTPYTQTRRRKN